MTISHLTTLVLASTLAVPVVSSAQDCSRPWISGLDPVPITRTVDQDIALHDAASQIVPRLADGTPDPNGRTVLLTIGMSNTSQVSDGLRVTLRRDTPDVAPTLRLVNGAQGGQAAREWAETPRPWETLTTRLDKYGVTDQQVGALLIMLTVKHPKSDATTTATQFVAYYQHVLALAEARFPHARIALIAPNYYGGYDVGQDKTPEPHQYAQALTMQFLQDSWAGRFRIAAWSPHTNGQLARWWDGLSLACSQMSTGGVHLNTDGKRMIGPWLRDWLWSQTFTRWWMRP